MTKDDLVNTFLALPLAAVAGWLAANRDSLDMDFIAGLRAEAEYLGYNEADLAGALTVLERAELATAAMTEPLARGLVWRGRASVWQRHNRFEESLQATHEAVVIYEQDGTPYDVAVARTIEVYLLGMLERFEEAISLAFWIRPHFEQAAFTLGQASLAHNLAHVYYFTWRLEEALAEYQHAHDLFLAEDDTLRAAWILHDMGLVAEQMDRLDQAHDYYSRAYPAFVAADDRFLLVKTKYNLAQICLRRDAYDEALQHLAQARADLTRIAGAPDGPDAAYVDLFEARVRRKLNQLDEGERLLNRALTAFEQAGHQAEVIQTLLELGHLLAEAPAGDKLTQALVYLEQAAARLQQMALPLLGAWVKLAQGKLLYRLGRTDEAVKQAEAARDAFAGAELPLRRAQAEVLWADCCYRRRPDQARQVYQAVLETVGEALPHLAADCWRGLGRLAMTAGDAGGAVDAYERAITLLDTLRRSLHSHSHQAGFSEGKGRLREDLLAALHQQPGREKQILGWVERFKAGALADLLASHPLDRQTDPDLVTLLQKRDQLCGELDRHTAQLTVGGSGHLSDQLIENRQRGPALLAHDTHQAEALAKIRRDLQRLDEQIAARRDAAYDWRAGASLEPDQVHTLLDEQTLCLAYYSAAGQLHALTLTQTPGDLQIHPLNISLADIERRWIQARRQVVRPRGQIAGVQARLAALWQRLIAPLADRLAGKRRLLILPHRGLFHLPFAGLYDPRQKQYLIERCTLQVVPSLTILARCRQQRPGQNSNPPLLAGYPGRPAQPDYLPAVKHEVEILAGLFPEADTLYGEAATLAAIRARMGRRSLIHLAGHVFYESANPLESGMPLAGGRWLRAADLYLHHGQLGGATVILSGCNSGRGRLAGEDVLGLTSAFLYAGAAGVIAGLWRVDDTATAALMQAFYRHLTGGLETAAALRQAQLDLLGSASYAAPYFWAPFILSGDSRTWPDI